VLRIPALRFQLYIAYLNLSVVIRLPHEDPVWAKEVVKDLVMFLGNVPILLYDGYSSNFRLLSSYDGILTFSVTPSPL